MTIEQAMVEIRAGKKVKRSPWTSTWLNKTDYQALCNQDLMAEDWEVVEERKLLSSSQIKDSYAKLTKEKQDNPTVEELCKDLGF